jgi:hypothetical protein
MNNNPIPMPKYLIAALLIRILLEYSLDASMSSPVVKRIIAITASHRLISESVKGIDILITAKMRINYHSYA